MHQQDAAVREQIAAIHAQSRAKYAEFKRLYEDMQQAMQRQRSEEVENLAEMLGRLEVRYQASVEDLTFRLQQQHINVREQLDERTTKMVCDSLVRELEQQERADRAAVEYLIDQARELGNMARMNLQPIGTPW